MPLPIFNKIQNKYLFLQDYQIEQKNFKYFVQGIKAYIPNSLQKIVLANNMITDDHMAMLLQSISSLRNGPNTLAIVQNGFGKKSIDAMV